MTNPEKKPSMDIQLEDLNDFGVHLLSQRAWECYYGDNSSDSIELFGQLVGLAHDRADVAEETALRFWWGTALHCNGDLLQAAVAMGPALSRDYFVGDRVLRNRLVTRFLLVGVDIPLPIDQLETAFLQAEELIQQWGWQDKESRLPLAKGRLALYRGKFDEAMRWAQVAMNNNEADPSAYATHTYLVLFMKACVANNRIDLLKELMAGRHRFELGTFRNTRRLVVNLAHATINRWEGDLDKALDFSQRAEERAWALQDHAYRFLALSWRVEILLDAGLNDQARSILAKLMQSRHTEVGHDGFDSRLLLGDYHVAEAKRLRKHPQAPGSQVASHFSEAIRIFKVGRKFGMEIDGRLRCSHKGDVANARLKMIEEIR